MTAARTRLARAIEHYQRSEFGAAEKLLKALAKQLGHRRDRTAQETFTYLAFVHAAFGRSERAVEAFERALAIKPDMRLDSLSPKLARLLAQARERLRAKLRALDHDPPRLSHTPPRGKLRYGQAVGIVALVRDLSAVKEVTLNYRIAGHRGFASVKMEREGPGSRLQGPAGPAGAKAGRPAGAKAAAAAAPGAQQRFVASIPTIAVVRPGVEYYIEAWDELGNGPGLKGSARAPIRLAVVGGPLAKPAQLGPRPWYERWWVWAIAAGVVATAAGVSVAAYLGRDRTARFNIGGLGDLGK